MCLQLMLYMAKGLGGFVGLVDADDGELGHLAQLKLEVLLDQSSTDVDEEVDAFCRERVAIDVVVADVFGKYSPSVLLQSGYGGDGGFFPLADDECRVLSAVEGFNDVGRERGDEAFGMSFVGRNLGKTRRCELE